MPARMGELSLAGRHEAFRAVRCSRGGQRRQQKWQVRVGLDRVLRPRAETTAAPSRRRRRRKAPSRAAGERQSKATGQTRNNNQQRQGGKRYCRWWCGETVCKVRRKCVKRVGVAVGPPLLLHASAVSLATYHNYMRRTFYTRQSSQCRALQAQGRPDEHVVGGLILRRE